MSCYSALPAHSAMSQSTTVTENNFEPLLTSLYWSGWVKGGFCTALIHQYMKANLPWGLPNTLNLHCFSWHSRKAKHPSTDDCAVFWFTKAFKLNDVLLERASPAWSHFTLISTALLRLVCTIYIAKEQCQRHNNSGSSLMLMARFGSRGLSEGCFEQQ